MPQRPNTTMLKPSLARKNLDDEEVPDPEMTRKAGTSVKDTRNRKRMRTIRPKNPNVENPKGEGR